MGIPIGGNWEQEEIYGNPYEEHKSVWELSDFDPFVEQNWLYSDPDNPSQCSYALLKIKADQLQKHRKRVEADRLCQLGNHLEAIALLYAMSAKGEPDIVTDFQLTDLLFQRQCSPARKLPPPRRWRRRFSRRYWTRIRRGELRPAGPEIRRVR